MKNFITLGLIVSVACVVEAQSVYAPLNQDYYHLIDRQEVLNKSFSPSIHSSFKPYKRVDIVSSLDSIRPSISSVDNFNNAFLYHDNWEFSNKEEALSKKPFLNKFYETQPDFYHADVKDFLIKVNPVLYLGFGRDANSANSPFINTRGIEVRGMIDKKIGFYTFLGENQAIFPAYVQRYTAQTGIVPNEAFWKKYSNVGVDFFTARGYFTFNATKHIAIQFGHDKNFIGNGYRSLLLSDFSAPSTFLKIQTKVWRIQYTNLFTELIADAPFTSDGSNGTIAFPAKFMTAHHLSINITDNFNFGVFEAIIFNRGDSTGSAFEWSYLNPVIFYRSIEQFTGSPDNALFGIDFKWNIARQVQLYGQGLLDEIVVSELIAADGWWGNKFSFQLGGKYYNAFGLPNLDLQAEYNFARPFTYSHESIFTDYAHYRQPLAHPIGANFKEAVFIANYQPINRLRLSTRLISANYGTDPVGENFGQDVLKSYNTRSMEYGNTTGQGISNNLLYVDMTASFMMKHNLFVDLKYVYRRLDSGDDLQNLTTHFTSLALRLNIAARDYSF